MNGTQISLMNPLLDCADRSSASPLFQVPTVYDDRHRNFRIGPTSWAIISPPLDVCRTLGLQQTSGSSLAWLPFPLAHHWF